MEQQLTMPKPRNNTIKSKGQYRVQKATGCALGHRGRHLCWWMEAPGRFSKPHLENSVCPSPLPCLCLAAFIQCSIYFSYSLLQIQYLPCVCLDFRHWPCFTPISLCPVAKFLGFGDLLECAVLAMVPSCLFSRPHDQEAAETFLVLHYHLLLKKKSGVKW